MAASPDILAVHAGAQPGAPAVIVDAAGGARPSATTFGELNAEVNRLARAFVSLGGQPGERLVWCGPNSLEVIVTIHAARKALLTAVPLSYRFNADEMAYVIDNSDATLVVIDAEQAPLLADVRDQIPKVREVLVFGGPAPDGFRSWDDALAAESDDEPELDAEPSAAGASMIYTSGTTGKPKGALGTQRNICGNLVSLAFAQMRGALRSDAAPAPAPAAPAVQQAQLLSVPFFHATGCHSVLCANTAFGGKLVMMHKWDAERAMQLIEREQITSFGGVPSMVWEVIEHPRFRQYDLSSVKSVGYGGAPAAPELVRRIKAVFPGGTPGNGYGLTETSSVTTFNNAADYERKPDSVGAAVPVCEVKIVAPDDARGTKLPIGEVGEIWIKGPNVVKGYWGKPDATAESFVDGWLRSGDLGRLDDEGFVYIVDRAKDMVIRGGENVYCVEVESALYDHPSVTDAAVVGIPHRVLGEEVGAVVTVNPGADVSEEQLRTHVAARLASFKVPVRIEIRTDPLPRNATGKILKRELREELAKRWGS
jgi:long-chain acyl-CoA synthetase